MRTMARIGFNIYSRFGETVAVGYVTRTAQQSNATLRFCLPSSNCRYDGAKINADIFCQSTVLCLVSRRSRLDFIGH